MLTTRRVTCLALLTLVPHLAACGATDTDETAARSLPVSTAPATTTPVQQGERASGVLRTEVGRCTAAGNSVVVLHEREPFTTDTNTEAEFITPLPDGTLGSHVASYDSLPPPFNETPASAGGTIPVNHVSLIGHSLTDAFVAVRSEHPVDGSGLDANRTEINISLLGSDGALRWSVAAPGSEEGDPDESFYPEVIANGVLLGSVSPDALSYSAMALDLNDGSVRWSSPNLDLGAASGEFVALGDLDNQQFVIADASSGATITTISVQQGMLPTDLVELDGGLWFLRGQYVSSPSRTYAVYTPDWERIWPLTPSEDSWGRDSSSPYYPMLDQSAATIADLDESGDLVGYDLTANEEAWRMGSDTINESGFAPLVGGLGFFFGTTFNDAPETEYDQTLVAIDARTGEQVATTDTPFGSVGSEGVVTSAGWLGCTGGAWLADGGGVNSERMLVGIASGEVPLAIAVDGSVIPM